jgi:serine/threonine protein kinase
MPNSSVMAGARTEDAKVDIGVSSFLEKNRSPFVDFGRNLAASSLAYQDEQSTYFVSELFSGGELFGHVSASRRFDEATARKYARQVIEGVASLHACGIAHRDISLENLVLGADDEVRIIDFGLAVTISTAGFAQEMYRGAVGKKFYRAPEMFPREDDKIRASGFYEARPVDAWAVGIALLIMVMGSPPWEMARGGPSGDRNFKYFLRYGLERHVAKLVGKEGVFSSELLDLLTGLLTESPQERMTIEAARAHPWFQEE